MTKNKRRGKPFEKGHKFFGDLSKPNYFHKGHKGKGSLGVKHTDAWKAQMSEKMKGEKHWNWQGGISKTWNARNKEKIAMYVKRRRASRKNAEGLHSVGEWELLKKQYNFTCPCCQRSEPQIKLTEDHIIPLSKGGSDYIENIQPLCGSCNSKKHTIVKKYEQRID